MQRRPTSTSNFGSGKRESHDASGFYARFADERLDLSDDSTVLPPREIPDPIRCGDAREMSELRDGEVALGHVTTVFRWQAVRGGGHSRRCTG